MKIKGLRWWILGMIVLITIINYLDRGTLNYMWAVNVKTTYPVAASATTMPLPYAVPEANGDYRLYHADSSTSLLKAAKVLNIEGKEISFHKRAGIAIDLGLVDLNQPEEAIDKDLKKKYSYIYMFFMVAYGISQLVSGKIYDRIGTRLGFVLSAIIWGTADMMTALARGIGSLSFFRVLLGLGEAGPWPGAVKSNAEWFPVKERAFAQGLFGAGGSIGNILAPIIISLLFLAFGWKSTFVIIGSLGLIWTIPWLILNRKSPEQHPWITEAEKEYIRAGKTATDTLQNSPGKSWGELLKERSSYAVILGRFFLDPVWWMFVAWLPIYLAGKFKLDIKQVAFSAWVPYVGAALGAIIGGWYSGKLIRQGKTVAEARKKAILTGAIITLPAMILAAFADTVNSAVLIMTLILAGFQFTIVNIQTLPSDYHTGASVGSLAGLGGASAVAGTILSMLLVPYITTTDHWVWFFVLGATLVPLSVGSVLLFRRR